jgi:hypothetical protein
MRKTNHPGQRGVGVRSGGIKAPTGREEFAGPLADAALALLAAFFKDREALAEFLAARTTAVPADRFLGIEPIAYQDVSEVLRLWETRAEFLDAVGKPRVLPLAGSPSFALLSQQAYPQLPPEVVLGALENGHAIETVDGYVRLLSRTKLVKDREQAAHARAALVSTRLLRSLVGNLDPAGASEKLFERTVLGHDIPRSQLPAIKAFMLRHGQQYLEDLDDWLETLQAPQASPNEDSVSAGACLFLFTDPPRTGP